MRRIRRRPDVRIVLAVCAALSVVLLHLLMPAPASAQGPSGQVCDLVQVTQSRTGINSQPSVNADGSTIAFWSTSNLINSTLHNNPDGNIEIFVASLDANASDPTQAVQGIQQVTDSRGTILGGFNFSPSTTADGTLVAFFSDQNLINANPDRNFEIFLYDVTTGQFTQLTDTQGNVNILPSISASGDRIAFASDQDWTGENPDGSIEIFVLDRTTDTYTQITDSEEGLNDQPALSGDGTRVAFASDRNPTGENADGSTEIFLANIDTNGGVTITQVTYTQAGESNFQPAIDADGSRIVFTSDRDGNEDIFVAHIGANGSISEERLTATNIGTVNNQPGISEDGTRIVFVRTQDGTQELLLYDAILGETSSIFTSSTDPIENPTTSADGTHIAYAANREIYAQVCKYTDLAVQTSAPATAVAGEPLTYTVSVLNSGPSVANNVHLTDTLPTDFNFQAMTAPAGAACQESGGTVTCNLGIVTAPVTTITLTGSISASVPAGTQLVNQANVTTASFDRNPNNNADTITRTLTTQARLVVTQQAGPEPVTAGETLTYTLHFTNTSPSDAQNVVITDSLPADVSLGGFIREPAGLTRATSLTDTAQVWTTPTLDAGASGTIVFTTTVDSSAIGGVTNTVTITSTTPDPMPADNVSVLTTAVDTSADLKLTKLDQPDANVIAGETLTYTLTYTNAGPSDARNVLITDTLPAAVAVDSLSATPAIASGTTYTWSLGTVAAQSSGSIVINATVDPAFVGTLRNSAGIRSTTAELQPADNNAGEDTPVTTEADLLVSQAAPSTVVAGEQITYTISVTNTGPSQARNVRIIDQLPMTVTYQTASVSTGGTCIDAGGTVTCTVGTMPVNATEQVTITAGVDPARRGTLQNDVQAISVEPDPNGAASTVTTTVDTVADIQASVAVTPTQVLAGASRLTYTIAITNVGPSLATNVTLTDTLPTGGDYTTAIATPACSTGAPVITCSLADLPPTSSGPSTVVTVSLDVLPSATDPMTNTVAVTSAEGDPTPATISTTTAVTRQAQLRLNKQESDDPVAAGDTLTYTVSVTNDGPSTATGVTISDVFTLPAGVSYHSTSSGCTPLSDALDCALPTLGVNATGSITLAVSVAPDVAAGTVITNSASVTAGEPNPLPASSATETITTTTDRRTTLAVSKIASSNPITAGTNLTYTITVDNLGPSTATNVRLTDTLPANGVDYASATASAGCTTTGGRDISCDFQTISASSTVTVAVPVDFDYRGVLTNTLAATADEATGTARYTDTTSVVGESTLVLTKTASAASVVAGTDLTYTLTIENQGPSLATLVTVTDTLPTAVQTYTVNAPGASCDTSGNPLTCTMLSLGISSIEHITITATIDDSASAGTITNTATATSSEENPAVASDSVDTTVTRDATLAITKVGPATVVAGERITYTVYITNTGPSSAKNTTLSDTLPAGVDASTIVVNPSDNSLSCSSTTQTFTCDVGTMQKNGNTRTQSFEIGVDVLPSTRGSLTNTATVTSTTMAGAVSDNATTTVTTDVALSITKAVTPNTTVDVGTPVTYTLSFGNSGASQATDVTISDTLPAELDATSVSTNASGGFSCTVTAPISCIAATLNPQAMAMVTITADVAASTPDGATIANTATVTATEDAGGDSATATVTAQRRVAMQITKDAPASVVAGDQLAYTVQVTNTGPISATNVTIEDTLPAEVDTSSVVTSTTAGLTCAGTALIQCTQNSLDPNASASVTITAMVEPATADGATIANTASVTATEDAAGTQDSASTNVSRSIALDIDKKVAPAPTVTAGTALTYTVAITNSGPSQASNVWISDTLPLSLTNLATSTSGSLSCGAGFRPLRCSLATMNPASSEMITVTGTVDPSAPENLTLSNAATVTATEDATGVTTPAVDVSVTRSISLTMGIAKTPSQVTPGDTLTYTISATNDGPSQATNVYISDTLELPPSVTLGTASKPECASPTLNMPNTYRCQLGTLAPFASDSITITIDVDNSATVGDIITSTVTVTATEDTSGIQQQDTATINSSAKLLPSGYWVMIADGAPSPAVPVWWYTVPTSALPAPDMRGGDAL